MTNAQSNRFRAAVRWIASPFRTAGLKVLCLTAPRRSVGDIELVNLATPGATELFFARLEEALTLLKKRAPSIFRRATRHFQRIVLLQAGGEFYHSGLKAYVLDLTTLKMRTASEVALAIVHEATHARIEKRGIRYEPMNRERIEQICIRAELGLAEHLSEDRSLVETIHRKLTSQWWSEDSLHQRRLDQLTGYGVPAWIVRAYDRLFHPSAVPKKGHRIGR